MKTDNKAFSIKRVFKLLISLILVCLGSVILVVTFGAFVYVSLEPAMPREEAGQLPASGQEQFSSQDDFLSVEELLVREEPLLKTLEHADNLAVEEMLARTENRFVKARNLGVPELVEEFYSLDGKWQVLKAGWQNLLEAGDVDHIATYVDEKIRYFMPELVELDGALNEEIENLDYKIRENRNELAVQLAADLDALRQDGSLGYSADTGTLLQNLDVSMENAAQDAIGDSFQVEILSLVGGELVAASTIWAVGVLSGSTLSGATTLGLGLFVGIGVDLTMSHFAEQRTVAEMQAKLDQTRQMFIYGDDATKGIRPLLTARVEQYHQTFAEKFHDVCIRVANR